MKLIIQDKYGKQLVYENPTFIPRVGERIGDWYFNPAPTVVQVIHFPSEKQIIVLLD